MIFLSLRTTEGSAAICVLSMAYEIASVASLLRNDIATRSVRRNDAVFYFSRCHHHSRLYTKMS